MECAICSEDVSQQKRISFAANLEKVEGTVFNGIVELFSLKLTPIKAIGDKSKRFLCRKCWGFLSTCIRKKRDIESRFSGSSLLSSKKRELSPQKPNQSKTGKKSRVETPTGKVTFTPKSKARGSQPRRTFVQKAANLIMDNNYKRAIKVLISQSYKAAIDFRSVVNDEITQEVKGYSLLENSYLTKELKRETLEEFSWEILSAEIQNTMPTLFRAVSSITQTKQSSGNRQMVTTIGTVIAMLLYKGRPFKWKFIPSVLGLMLYRGGCARKIFNCLHALGMCQSYGTTLKNVDKVGSENTRELSKWKRALEKQECDAIHDAQDFLEDEKELSIYSQEDDSVNWSTSEDECKETVPEAKKKKSSKQLFQGEQSSGMYALAIPLPNILEEQYEASFSMCFDNVGIEEKARHQGLKSKTTHIWTSAFASLNRVDSGSAHEFSSTKRCLDLPLETFVPSNEEFEGRRKHFEYIVASILVAHLNYFIECKKPVEMTHRYRKEMARRSHVVTIGIIPCNPGTSEGCLQVLDHLHQYVPFPDGRSMAPTYIPVHGDAASVYGVLSAQKARVASIDASERLEGIIPVPGDFHRRMIMNQDTMNLLFKADSSRARGTLSNIKTVFGLTGVKPKVSESFNEVEDLLNLVAKGLVCLAGMEILQLKTQDQARKPGTTTLTPEQELADVAKKITTHFWFRTPTTDAASTIEADTDASEKRFCHCKEHIDDIEMIECANIKCTAGRWFHLPCVGLDVAPTEDEWFCSNECRESGGSAWCVCRQKTTEVLIECQAKDACTRGRLFHASCAGYVPEFSERKGKPRICNMPREWCCSEACRQTCGTDTSCDRVQEYTRALGFRALLDMYTRDVIRSGDGDAINREWKTSMPEFSNLNHVKYFHIGHNLLAGVNGVWPENVATAVTWNRTVNERGGHNRNVPMDRVNEFLNRDFKAMLKDSSGRYTKKHVLRTGRIAGAMGKELDRLFVQKIAMERVAGRNVKETKQQSQPQLVRDFVQTYMGQKLLCTKGRRQHKGFEEFSYTLDIKNPNKMKNALQRHSKKMDDMRDSYPNPDPDIVTEIRSADEECLSLDTDTQSSNAHSDISQA